MRKTIKHQSGLALMEMILGVALVAIMIGIFVSVTTTHQQTNQRVAASHSVSALLNSIIKYSQKYIEDNRPFEAKNIDNLNSIADKAGIDDAFVKQLSADGVDEVSLTIEGGDDDDCTLDNSCETSWSK